MRPDDEIRADGYGAGSIRRQCNREASLKTDIRNAGGEWVDQEVMVDNGLVTSRKPEDIPAFNAKMIEEIAEGRHSARKAA